MPTEETKARLEQLERDVRASNSMDSAQGMIALAIWEIPDDEDSSIRASVARLLELIRKPDCKLVAECIADRVAAIVDHHFPEDDADEPGDADAPDDNTDDAPRSPPSKEAQQRLVELEGDIRRCRTFQRVKARLEVAVNAPTDDADAPIQVALSELLTSLDAPRSDLTIPDVADRVADIRTDHYPQSRQSRRWRVRGNGWWSGRRAVAAVVLIAAFAAVVWALSPDLASRTSESAAPTSATQNARTPASSIPEFLSCANAKWRGSTTAILTAGSGKWEIRGIRSGSGSKCIFASGVNKGKPVPASCVTGTYGGPATNICPDRDKL